MQGTAIAEIHQERTTRTKADAPTGKAAEHTMGGDWWQGVRNKRHRRAETNVTDCRSRTYQADFIVNKKPLRMEIDTGAAVSIISENQQKELFPDTILHTSRMELKTYTGERMAVMGECDVQVQYQQQSKTSR